MSENIVLIETNEDETVDTIILNRPKKKNAINRALSQGIHDAIDKVVSTKSRVVVITGTDEFFSSGVDLTSLVGGDTSSELMNPPVIRYHNSTFTQETFNKIGLLEKPVIAKISGYCFGMGFELTLACDFRFCLESSTFWMTEAKVGIVPDVGGTTRLTRLVGIPNANEIILRARRFDGNEAYRLGVVHGVAKTKEELDAMVQECIDDLIESAPLAVGMGKKLIQSVYGKDIYHGLELENLTNSQLFQTQDIMTGAISRLQKKKPQWKGK
ncbi:MAG: enoyl-CoA hydratase/isomerase family protein [Promethearchaeota archaeon]